MILPLMLATALLLSGLFAYGMAMHLIVRVLVRVIRGSSGSTRSSLNHHGRPS
jgi:hypothetical protein